MIRKTLLLVALASTPWISPRAQTSEPPVPEAPVGKLATLPPDEPQRVEMAKVQIVLDRAGFRPGKIDGLGGEFTQKAADRYAAVRGIPNGQTIDVSSVPQAYVDYTVTEKDTAWVGETAAEPPEQAKLKRMPYADTWEAIAEKFHTDLDFLKELNPSLKDAPTPGDKLRVPAVTPFEMSAVTDLQKSRSEEAEKKSDDAEAEKPEDSAKPVLTLVVLTEPRVIELYENDKLAACFPCTPGSEEQPVPAGEYRITSNTLMPTFRWDKSVLETGRRSDDAYELPPGPNNPVGIVWLAINLPSRGMHGTPSPDQIGRNASHGCIRLANWDAWELARRVKAGTKVVVK